jgi:hypothetical protein
MLTEIKKVIVSSTLLDLPTHRQKVRDACLRLRLLPLMMEHLPASSAEAVRVSRSLVNDADMYVGVFAHRYGFVPDGHETSITEMEYELAKHRRIERLIFVMADDHPIVIGDVEFGVGRENIAALKERLLAENTVSFFHSAEDLSASVVFSLSHYLGPVAESFRLGGAKQELYTALASLDPEVGIMYFAALMTLENTGNPDRFALAAHGLRELMEKLPKYVDVPIVNKGPALNERVRVLAERRALAIRQSVNRDGPTWRGEIDDHLRDFLCDSDGFFEQFAAEDVTRRGRAATILRGLDPSAAPLPEKLEEFNIAKWQKCNDYFVRVSHHSRVADENEFGAYVSELETLLIDRLAPRTSDDFAAIDQLIKEGEAGGTA